ncbi:MAG: hypothetical protein WC378_06770 [Opitutaceae bacterium]|jgi:hypothetical protein
MKLKNGQPQPLHAFFLNHERDMRMVDPRDSAIRFSLKRFSRKVAKETYPNAEDMGSTGYKTPNPCLCGSNLCALATLREYRSKVFFVAFC